MRYVNVLVASAAVVIGFAGSLTAANALSVPAEGAPVPAVLGLLDLAPAEGTTLTVTFQADEKSAPVVMKLTCDPTGGDHPRAAEACDSLATAKQSGEDPFAKPAPDEICTYIYGGPQTATVVGNWNGENVNAKFSRSNGCEIGRWNAIEPVLSPKATSAKTVKAKAGPAVK